jgi:hypothetical protein
MKARSFQLSLVDEMDAGLVYSKWKILPDGRAKEICIWAGLLCLEIIWWMASILPV